MTTAASAEPASAAATAPHLRRCSSVTAGAAAAINGVNESSGATGASTRCTRSAPASRMIAHPTKTAAAAREMNFISPRSILVPSKHYGPCKHNRHIDSDLGMTPTLQRCIDLRVCWGDGPARRGWRVRVAWRGDGRSVMSSTRYSRQTSTPVPCSPGCGPRSDRSQPVSALEDDVQQHSRNHHDGGRDGKTPLSAEPGVGHIHPVEPGDKGGPGDDRRPAGDLLGDDVHPVALNGQVRLED